MYLTYKLLRGLRSIGRRLVHMKLLSSIEIRDADRPHANNFGNIISSRFSELSARVTDWAVDFMKRMGRW